MLLKQLVLASIILICTGVSSLNAQESWTKNAGNPVLRRDTVMSNMPNDLIAISDCWVVKEGTEYKMWYTCGGINYPTDTLLRSRICYATSSDGINWSKFAGNPVMDVSYTGAWDSLGVETATIIFDSMAPVSEKYKMWYAGQYYNSYRYDIGYASSPDGISWTKHTEPVLLVGGPDEWDNGFLEGPSVIKDGSLYKMWYCGYDVVVDGNGTDGKANIGYATSDDGINWTKFAGNPVLSTGTNSWDRMSVQDPHVIKEGTMYYMWYGGNDVDGYGQEVGFAVSEDGITWDKSELNPALTKGNIGQWDANTASFPSVLHDDGNYKMWYTGKDIEPLPENSLDYYWEIGYASSQPTSIIDWTLDEIGLIKVYPNPVVNQINVHIDFNFEKADIRIYYASGQQIKALQIINNQEVLIDAKDLINGLYFIFLSTENRYATGTFIINQ